MRRAPLVVAFAGLALLGILIAAALRVQPGADRPADGVARGFPRDVSLAQGSVFHVAALPARVVPTSARCVDLVAALVEPSRVAALPEQAFEYTTLGEREALFAALPRFDAYLAEPVLELLPDLVIADHWQSADTHARLREAGVAVLVLPPMSDWQDAVRDLRLLGQVLGAEERAAAVIADGETRIARLAERARLRPAWTALSYSSFGAQGFSAGSGTTLAEMMRMCGLTNRLAQQGREGHCEITFEDLLLLDPEVIVVSRPLRGPVGQAGDRGGASEQILLGEPALRTLRAVAQRRIASLPAGLFASASQQIVRGAELLAEQIDGWLAEAGK